MLFELEFDFLLFFLLFLVQFEPQILLFCELDKFSYGFYVFLLLNVPEFFVFLFYEPFFISVFAVVRVVLLDPPESLFGGEISPPLIKVEDFIQIGLAVSEAREIVVFIEGDFFGFDFGEDVPKDGVEILGVGFFEP